MLRPRRRGECVDGPRPCPWLSCRHHALWARSPRELRRLDDDGLLELAASLETTCTLDVADEGGVSLREVGEVIGSTRERARQIEVVALRKLHERVRGAVGRLPGDLGPEWEGNTRSPWDAVEEPV